MSSPRTLNDLTDLKSSRFGRPPPRQGLNLLHWFAHDFIFFNNNGKLCWKDHPQTGCYGFHRFKNRRDRNGVQLLPAVNLTYYVVGNLNSPGANELPDFVRKDYASYRKGNNMDRIIVSVDDQCVDIIYVTEHSDHTEFNKDATYCISNELIMTIREMTRKDFLLKTGFSGPLVDYSIIEIPTPRNDYD
ncbi:vacuolar import and degradation protein 30-like, partial [Clarias magur]